MLFKVIFRYSILLPVCLCLFVSCLPEKGGDAASCEAGQEFDEVSRTCYETGFPDEAPVGLLRQLVFDEDEPYEEVTLTYMDQNSDYVKSCQILNKHANVDIKNYSVDPNLDSSCICVGGTCTVNVKPALNFNGITEFSYILTDESNLVSDPKIISVIVNAVDDAPYNDSALMSPLGVHSFTEDTSQLYYLGYGDVEGDIATDCVVTNNFPDDIDLGTCSCSSGVCQVTVQGKQDFNCGNCTDPSNYRTFAYSVYANGKWSDPTPEVSFCITAVRDTPVNTGGTNTTFNEGSTATVTLGYSGIDDQLTVTCTILNENNVSVDRACQCPNGVCDVRIKGINDDFNTSQGAVASFDYTITTTDGSDARTSTATTVYLTINAVNDYPELAIATSLTGYEDVTLTATFSTIEEGGADDGSYEDYQELSIKVKSGNTSILPDNNIVAQYYKDGVATEITRGGYDYVSLQDGTDDSNGGVLVLKMTPSAESSNDSTPFNVTFQVKDDSGDTATASTFIDLSVRFLDVNDPPTISFLNFSTLDGTTTGTPYFEANVGGYTTTPGIVFDEGGSSEEDVNSVSLKIEVTDDPHNLLLESDIDVYYDLDNDGVAEGDCDSPDPVIKNECIGNAQNSPLEIGDGVDNVSAYNVLLKIYLSNDSIGDTVYLKITAYDNAGESHTESLMFQIHPIGAIHGGWKHIKAIGPKTNVKGEYISDVGSTYDNKCDGGKACTGTQSPCTQTNQTDCSLVVPDEVGVVYYNSASRIRSISTGTNTYLWEEYRTSTVTLEWNTFEMTGYGDDSDATIEGWKVFRRKYNEDYDFKSPISGTDSLSSSTRSYTDTSALINTVYFYLVRPVDNKYHLITPTGESFSEVRILSPPENMAFVHRWMVNQEVCSKMHMNTTSGDTSEEPEDQLKTYPSNNFACPYAGPGEQTGTLGNFNSYYDIGKDLLVDIGEAGCPWTTRIDNPTGSCDENNGCIGNSSPVGTVTGESGLIYYNRGDGICYIYDSATGWSTTLTGSTTLADESRNALLPPLTNVTATDAKSICEKRTALTNTVYGLTGNALTFTIPSRKYQIAYSSWHPDTSDTEAETLEVGLSLNSSAKCNSSFASGVDSGFTDAILPFAIYGYSVGGTSSSGIRSIYTASEELSSSIKLTELCSSRYGVQDSIGNVSEWTSDFITCYEGTYVCKLTTDDFTMSDSDMSFGEVHPTIGNPYRIYVFDGNTGPCIDTVPDDGIDCDTALTGWYFEDESYSSGMFIFPVGIPAHTDFKSINHPNSDISPFLLEIGPTSGITETQLRNDYFAVNASNFHTAGGGYGYMTTGGNYKSGSKAGRFNFEFFPSTEANSEIGFRCMVPIDNDDYLADTRHTYEYDF